MKIVVIGAGIAGAAAAHVLRQNVVEPVVLEASRVVGGRTHTAARDGFTIDSGAIFAVGSYTRTLRYLRESGHHGQMQRWAARTAVTDESGTKREVRFDRPWSLLTLPRLNWVDRVKGAWKAATLVTGRRGDPFDIDDLAELDDGRTLAEWARSNLGERGYEYLVRPLMGPLTGANPTRISTAFRIALLSKDHSLHAHRP